MNGTGVPLFKSFDGIGVDDDFGGLDNGTPFHAPRPRTRRSAA
ncbi:hypothetical protein ACWCXX_23650 [Streptomyces sp. NPDC001732]